MLIKRNINKEKNTTRNPKTRSRNPNTSILCLLGSKNPISIVTRKWAQGGSTINIQTHWKLHRLLVLAGTKRQISINWRKADFKILKTKPLKEVGQRIWISFLFTGSTIWPNSLLSLKANSNHVILWESRNYTTPGDIPYTLVRTLHSV